MFEQLKRKVRRKAPDGAIISGASVRKAKVKWWMAAACAAIVTGLAPWEPGHVDLAAPTYPATTNAAVAEIEAFAAPKLLQADLQRLRQSFGEDVKIAVLSLDANWTAHVGGEIPAPQQSVSKLWVAIATLDAIDRGQLAMDASVLFTEADRSVFYQPIVAEMQRGAVATTNRDLLRRAIVESDNAANDLLMRTLGGADAVEELVRGKGLDVRIGAEERDLQATIAGLKWRPQFGYGTEFKRARAELPLARRLEARDRYLAEPADGASAIAVTKALAQLHRGELLSPASSRALLDWMEQATTGPRRLKAGLPRDWRIAHKTGTGQDLDGGSIGINDVGILTAPDGKAYAVAVMIPYTRQPVSARLELMQAVAGAVAAEWRRSAPLSVESPEEPRVVPNSK